MPYLDSRQCPLGEVHSSSIHNMTSQTKKMQVLQNNKNALYDHKLIATLYLQWLTMLQEMIKKNTLNLVLHS